MVNYKAPVVDFTKVRKSNTIPDQSLSVQEIVKRYVRGIPVDVVQREAVYVDQNNHDLEKLSRMDFGEKAEFARSEADRLRKWQDEMHEESRAKAESEAKASAEKAATIKAVEAKSIVVP